MRVDSFLYESLDLVAINAIISKRSIGHGFMKLFRGIIHCTSNNDFNE